MGGVAEKMASTKMGVQWFRAFGSGGFVLAETTRSFSTEQGSGADEGNAARALPCNLHRTAATRTSSASAVGRSDWGRTVSEPAGRSTLFSKLPIRGSRTAIKGLQDQSHQVAPFTELLAETTDQTNKTNGAAIDDGQCAATGLHDDGGLHAEKHCELAACRGVEAKKIETALPASCCYRNKTRKNTTEARSVATESRRTLSVASRCTSQHPDIREVAKTKNTTEARSVETESRKNSALLGAGGMCVGAAAAPLKKQEKWGASRRPERDSRRKHTRPRRQMQGAAILCWRLTKRIKKPAKRIKDTPK